MHQLRAFLVGLTLSSFPTTQATTLPQTQAGLTYDVHPRVVWKHTLGTGFDVVPGLRVLVTNPTDKPLLFAYGCGGNVPVLVRGIGNQLKDSGNGPFLACTTERRTKWIAPGRTVMFPSFSWVDLAQLAPGTYR